MRGPPRGAGVRWRSLRSGHTATGPTVDGRRISLGCSGRECLADTQRQIDEDELATAGALELVDAIKPVADARIDHAIAVCQEEYGGLTAGAAAANEGVREQRRRRCGRPARRRGRGRG